MYYRRDSTNYLSHYGVKGQKKGVRRYQNEDGSLTAEGYTHYGRNPPGARRKKKMTLKKFLKKLFKRGNDLGKKLPRKISTVSDDEIIERTARLRLEGNYYKAKADRRDAIIRSREKKMSEGRKFFLEHAWKFSESVVKEWIKDNAPSNDDNNQQKKQKQPNQPNRQPQQNSTP